MAGRQARRWSEGQRWGVGVLLVASALAASGCGKSDGASDASGAPACDPPCAAGQACSGGRCLAASADGCIEATAQSIFRLAAGADSGWFTEAYGAELAPELGDGWQALSMKLRSDATGTFDLAEEPPNTDDCTRCVYVAYDGSGDHFQLDLAVSGTLTIDTLDRDTGEAQGTLTDVTFRHLEEVGLHSFDGFAADAHCVHLAEATFDTRNVPGAPCLAQGDCPNAKLQACDPRSGTCVAAACTADEPTCPGTDVCQIQNPWSGAGACYAACTPFTSGACPEDQDCLPTDYVGATGVCKRQGPGAPEPTVTPEPTTTCEAHQIATGCGAGHVCATEAPYWHYDQCFAQCDFFASEPGCAAGKCWLKLHNQGEVDTTWLCGAGDCHYGGLCIEAENDVPYGERCPDDWEREWSCGGDDEHLGICLDDSAGALRCRQLCRLDAADCPAGEICTQVVVAPDTNDERAIPGVGYCAPS